MYGVTMSVRKTVRGGRAMRGMSVGVRDPRRVSGAPGPRGATRSGARAPAETNCGKTVPAGIQAKIQVATAVLDVGELPEQARACARE